VVILSRIQNAAVAAQPVGRVQNMSSKRINFTSKLMIVLRRWKGKDLKIQVFWVVTKCGLVNHYRNFKGPCCQEVQEEALEVFYSEDGGKRYFETSVTIFQWKRPNITDDTN
jgi:hypothetical protein